MIWIFLLLIVGLMFALTGISGAPWVPARKFDLEPLLKDAGLKKGDLYIELGCGDGRLLAAAADHGATAVGYELNPILWLVAYLRNIRRHQVSVRFGDLWKADLSNADVVMAFLMARTLPRLEKKAMELKSGARLVSYIFPLSHHKAIKHGKSWFVYQY
jgi:ribosomal protein L11 methylase PrmA